MIEGASKEQQNAYRSGRNSRDFCQPKSPPGYLNWEMRHWWYAGFNDRDIEIDGPETPSKVVNNGNP